MENIEMNKSESPFRWQGKPSMFLSDPVFNGIRTAVEQRSAQNVKNTMYLRGSNIMNLESGRQAIAYIKAKSK